MQSLINHALQRYLTPSSHLRHHRHHASASTVPDHHHHHRHRSISDLDAPLPPLPHSHSHSHPRPQLREEDECPVCHHALPPKGPDGSETEREKHVRACIELHFSGSTPSSNRPHPSAATQAAVAVTIPIPAQSSSSIRSSSGAQQQTTSSSDTRSHNNQSHPLSTSASATASNNTTTRRRVPGMLTYLATEKDCVVAPADEDVTTKANTNATNPQPAECVICFEEFEPGVEMGRLE
ncbi:MAG: hypothetical protein Q9228_005611, partial [Teloschistes exilis]